MTTYIMILLFLSNETATSAEFLSKESCEAAKVEILKERTDALFGGRKAIIWCVKK